MAGLPNCLFRTFGLTNLVQVTVTLNLEAWEEAGSSRKWGDGIFTRSLAGGCFHLNPHRQSWQQYELDDA